jgi:alkylated DNA repair dioxygenase AlkB
MSGRRIDLGDGAEVVLWEAWIGAGDARDLFELLRREIPWEQREIRIMGRPVMQPRLVAWVGDADAVYTYSGVRNVPVPWTPALLDLRRRVEATTEATYNSVLLNLYRDERDSMGFHQDDEKELGREPVIASLSLGATRRFQLRRAKTKRAAATGGRNPDVAHAVAHVTGHDLALGDGSLIVMRGTIQHLFRHGVPKEKRPVGPRINLTFRQIYPDRR